VAPVAQVDVVAQVVQTASFETNATTPVNILARMLEYRKKDA
jgi:hypothetical protein